MSEHTHILTSYIYTDPIPNKEILRVGTLPEGLWGEIQFKSQHSLQAFAVAGVSHSMVADFQEGAAPEQVFRETPVEAARFLLAYSLKSQCPLCCILWVRSESQASTDSEEGTT